MRRQHHADQEPRPLFLVGCPRSGTTLLQSILASHPAVLSLPETHFFPAVLGPRPASETLRRAAGRWRRVHSHPLATGKLRDMGIQQADLPAPTFLCPVRRYVAAFRAALDRQTRAAGKKAWLEKTPRHLHYLAEIEAWFEDARIIHLQRDGRDVIASLHELGLTRPESWWQEYRDLDHCINRWISDVRLSRFCQGRRRHHIVLYGDLVTNPEESVRYLCRALGLAYVETMLSQYHETYASVRQPGAVWTDGVEKREIRRGAAGKFERILADEQQAHVTKRIATAGLTDLRAFFGAP